MAKKDKNEDDYKNENLDNSSNQDDEDFGLPNLDDDSDDNREEPTYEDTPTQEEDTASSSTYVNEEETESTYYADTADSSETVYEEDVYEDERPATGYVPPKKPSIAPVIITLAIIVILACFAVWFFFIREPAAPVITEQPVVKDTTAYVVEKPVEVIEPEIKEPEEPKIGTVNTLSSRTGRSYVVVGSFFDADMAQDYADELAQDGISAYVIPPFGKSKFNRVAIEETGSFAEASSRATELAGQFKETPWPLKY